MPEPGATGSGTSGGMGAGEQDVAGDLDLSRADDAVERDVEERNEGGRESTRTSFTKDSTADQSLSNYDNFSDMDFSFEAQRVGRRDANSAIGDYVARVAGVSLDARVGQKRADEAAHRASMEATRDAMVLEKHNAQLASRENALAAARLDRTQFSDSSTYAADWMARVEAENEAEKVAARIDGSTPSLVDDWGMTEFGYRSRLGRKGALSDEDLAELTRVSEQDRYGLLGSEGALDAARRANAVARTQAAESAEQATLESQLEASRSLDAQIAQKEAEERAIAIGPDFGLRDANVQVQINNAAIKEADAVLESEDATVEQKSAAISDKNRLMMNQRRMRARQEYNAVTDPTASVYSKDVHTRVGFDKLTDYIDSIANRPFFNTGLTYTKHDPATTMKVQKAIERYDDIYGSWLNDMGKRNSKEINAKGFDLSKGLSGFNMIQGLMNKIGWAYHATETEKLLRALKEKWGLGPDDRDDPDIELLKKRCNERSGYKWDEESNSCVPISNLNTDYQNYLP